MHKQIKLLMIGFCSIVVLSGCFRDAADSNIAPTQREVRVQDIGQTSTNVPPPTQTPEPEATDTPVATDTLEPILLDTSPTADKTLVIGGPPTGNEEDLTATPTIAPTEAAQEAEPSATNTDAPPTATPSRTPSPTQTSVPDDVATMAQPGFGDTGISPTPSATRTPTQESFLATPTDIPPQDECVYLVQGGDTILAIAREFDLTADDFFAVNPVLAANPDNLQIGQALRIPGCESEADETTSSAITDEDDATVSDAASDTVATTDETVQDGPQVHIVVTGDTLFSIALAYEITLEELIAANDALIDENSIIFPDQELIIPDPEAVLPTATATTEINDTDASSDTTESDTSDTSTDDTDSAPDADAE